MILSDNVSSIEGKYGLYKYFLVKMHGVFIVFFPFLFVDSELLRFELCEANQLVTPLAVKAP